MRRDLTVTVDAWGNIIVAGPVAVGSAMSFVAKLDKDGNLLWHETLRHEGLSVSAAGSVPPPPPDLWGDQRESVEPLALDAEIEAYQHRLGRQSRLARWIGAAIAFAGLFAMGVIGGAAAGKVSATSNDDVRIAQSGVDEAVYERVEAAQSIGASAPPAMVDAAGPMIINDDELEPLHGEPDEIAVEPAMDADGEGLDEPVFEDVVALRAEVIALLNEGRYVEAVAVGERLVLADRESAFGYLCLGAALQDLGRGPHARANYDACVRNATRGDVSECMALGGRR